MPSHGLAPGRPPGRCHRRWDKTFKIGLILRGLDGILENAGGILLVFLSPHAIKHLARTLAAHELSQDPHDLIARYILHTTSHLTASTTLFGAVYLLSHGIAKIVLVTLVLRDKLWAYPWLIALLLAFIGYQLYRITAVHFSVGLTALTVFDAPGFAGRHRPVNLSSLADESVWERSLAWRRRHWRAGRRGGRRAPAPPRRRAQEPTPNP